MKTEGLPESRYIMAEQFRKLLVEFMQFDFNIYLPDLGVTIEHPFTLLVSFVQSSNLF